MVRRDGSNALALGCAGWSTKGGAERDRAALLQEKGSRVINTAYTMRNSLAAALTITLFLGLAALSCRSSQCFKGQSGMRSRMMHKLLAP